jgi:uncharacterized membrane protein YhhN
VITTAAWVWFAVAGVFALGDWIAVALSRKPLEYVCKPATMAALIGAALALTPEDPTQRGWFVAALVLSMLGDVFLMLPERPQAVTDTFTLGLGSFLLGHLAFVAGFAARGVELRAVTVLAVVPVFIAPRMLRDAGDMRIPVGIYMAAIVTMLAFALSSGIAVAAVGAVLFVSSDAMIGWSRFVREHSVHKLGIIVTYHLAQGLLVVSLAM